jgi:hypothetical protein
MGTVSREGSFIVLRSVLLRHANDHTVLSGGVPVVRFSGIHNLILLLYIASAWKLEYSAAGIFHVYAVRAKW